MSLVDSPDGGQVGSNPTKDNSGSTPDIDNLLFPGSSVVELTAVNRPVGGSNPSLGAKHCPLLAGTGMPELRSKRHRLVV